MALSLEDQANSDPAQHIVGGVGKTLMLEREQTQTYNWPHDLDSSCRLFLYPHPHIRSLFCILLRHILATQPPCFSKGLNVLALGFWFTFVISLYKRIPLGTGYPSLFDQRCFPSYFPTIIS